MFIAGHRVYLIRRYDYCVFIWMYLISQLDTAYLIIVFLISFGYDFLSLDRHEFLIMYVFIWICIVLTAYLIT